jgi:N-formylglutamate amidohydrolase
MIVLFAVKLMEQEPFEYIDGYRSSCKYYLNGNINIILSAPHGGNLMPDDVPDRTEGIYIRSSNSNDSVRDEERCQTTVVKDTATVEFAENVANELFKKWNFKPFIIIAKWHRKKVDFNREIREGTLNHPEAKLAYENYHMNLNIAIDRVNQLFNKGLLIDIHGHSQAK